MHLPTYLPTCFACLPVATRHVPACGACPAATNHKQSPPRTHAFPPAGVPSAGNEMLAGAAASSLTLARHAAPSSTSTSSPKQVFQAYMLVLAQVPQGDWPIPEELLAVAQDAWVQSTKKVT